MKCKYLKVGTGAAGLNMKRLFKSGAELLLIALAHAHYNIIWSSKIHMVDHLVQSRPLRKLVLC